MSITNTGSLGSRMRSGETITIAKGVATEQQTKEDISNRVETILGTRSSITPDLNADELAYKGNKKGFSVTETASHVISYMSNSSTSNNGSMAVVDTWFGSNGSVKLRKGPRIVPYIPYRFTFSDTKMLNLLKVPLSKQPQEAVGTKLLYNPGFDRGSYGDVGSINFNDLDTYKDSARRYEINLLRGDESSMIGQTFRFWNSTDPAFSDLRITPSNIRMDDYEVGMVVIPEDDHYDLLYLSVCSRVTTHCSYQYGSGQKVEGRQLEWSVPIVLKYRVSKSYTTSGNNSGKIYKLHPIAWGYPVSTSSQYNINTVSSSGLENTQMIMGRQVLAVDKYGKKQSSWWPMDLGCLCDIDWNSSFNRLEIACIRTETIDIFAKSGTSYTSSRNYHSNTSFPDNKYNHLIRSRAYHWDSTRIPEHLQITMAGSIAWITSVMRSYNKDEVSSGPQVLLESRRTVSGASISTKLSRMSIMNADSSDVCVSSLGNSYFSFVDIKNNRSLLFSIPSNGIIASYVVDPEALCLREGGYGLTLKNTQKFNWLERLEKIYRPFAKDIYVSRITSNGGPIHKLNYLNFNRYILSNRSVDSVDVVTYQDIHSRSKDGIRWFESRDFIIDKNQTVTKTEINRIEAVQMSGVPTGQSFVSLLNSTYDTKGLDAYEVYRVSIDEFRFGSPVIEYWRDIVFGSGYWKNDDHQWDENRGIKIQVNITGCFGIRSVANPLTVNDWDSSIPAIDPNRPGGVKIDLRYRPDMSFRYSGDKEVFEDTFNTFSGGYWAVPSNKFEVTCTWNGENILSDTDSKLKLYPSFWGYDEGGYFNCYLPISINTPIDESNRDFTNADYVLSGVVLTAHAYNSYGKLMTTDSFTFDIDPPNPTGYVRSDVYKTVGDISFNYYRDSAKNSTTYTEIHDIVKYSHPQDGEGIKNSTTTSLRTFNQNTGTFTIPSASLSRGEGIHYTYSPKLYGIKAENGIQTTKSVTYCNGHRYSLGDVALYVGMTGVYGSDILTSFSSWKKPYQYVDINNSGMEFKAVVDVNHENWQLVSPRSSYSDINIYPGISGIYIYAVDGLNWGPGMKENGYDKEFVPVIGDNTKTYPNIRGDLGWGKFWWEDYFLANSIPLIDGVGVYATGVYLAGTSASVSSQELILPIWKSGRYRVYLTVEDEFGQFSEFCLTNPTFNYNHPFEAING